MEFVDVDDNVNFGRGVDELSFDWKNVDVGWITAGIFLNGSVIFILLGVMMKSGSSFGSHWNKKQQKKGDWLEGEET